MKVAPFFTEAEMLKRLQRAGVPARFLMASFKTYRPTTVKQAAGARIAEEFARDWQATSSTDTGASTGLFLLGPPGTGKTHLAAAALRRAVELEFELECMGDDYGTKFVFVGWCELQPMLAQWPKRDDGRLVDRVLTADLLVIDDLQQPDARTWEAFNWLTEMRYRRAPTMHTVITANLSVTELKDGVGDRAFDRLRDGARLAVLDGPSHRTRFAWDGPCEVAQEAEER